ncbi:MAG: response regulator [Rhizobiales bacterium]|nr:response regulator [Hyphomicrobiales bacterium]
MHQPRMLIVEDEYLVRDMIVREMTLAGFEVLEAANAEAALALTSTIDRLELLFTDIRLPGMNGWQLAEQIRLRYMLVPVIYTSGYAEQVTLLPSSQFLQKPYMPSQVLQAAGNLGIKLPSISPN